MEMVETRSGLFVAAETASPASVAALLRSHDDRLRLVPGISEEHQTQIWRVYRWRGPDRPAECVCAWTTPDGTPLPLSSQLLEKVQQLDKTTVGAAPDPDIENAKLKAARAKDHKREREAIRDEHKPYIDRRRVSVSQGPRPTMHDRL